MKSDSALGAGGFLREICGAIVVAVLLLAIGYFPTKRLAGTEAVPAMVAGCVISMLSSIVGALPLRNSSRGPVSRVPQAVLLSTALRFLVVLILALSVALSGWFVRAPLLVWVAISYMVFLTTDTVRNVRMVEPAGKPKS